MGDAGIGSVARRIGLGLITVVAVAAGFASQRDAAAQRPATPGSPGTSPRRDATAGLDAGVPSTPSGPRPVRHCPDGMLVVEGEYCPNVDQQCIRWLDPEQQMRCAEFAPSRCSGRRRHVAVCMDEYEYPNRRGASPQVMVTWYAARRACEARGARLCTMAEWTFACEGEQMNPYPYGLVRNRDLCHFDRQTMRPDRARLGNPSTSADESARLYEAVPSGQYDRCVSPFGIHDMTGNVDEWVRNETGHPFASALKGGWWGPIRARCRPTTLAHNETFVYYQIGFRCCADPT
jgi:sulfatase modifying factor 1